MENNKDNTQNSQDEAGGEVKPMPEASGDLASGIPLSKSDTPSSEILFSEEDLKALQAKAAKADEHWDRLLRLSAEFDNFKKRAARDRQDAIRYANEGLLEKLIPTIDNFEMALAVTVTTDSTSVDSLKMGINMVYQQLKGVITDSGIETLEVATGAVFDPNWQEAVSQEDSESVPEGHVVRQLRKGYRLRERLLRPATVVVSKKPSSG